MTAPKYRRYPIAPVLRLLGDASSREVERTLGVHWTTVNRWRNEPDTLIVEWDADKYAVKLGRHPSELWVDWFDINKPIEPWRKLKQRT